MQTFTKVSDFSLWLTYSIFDVMEDGLRYLYVFVSDSVGCPYRLIFLLSFIIIIYYSSFTYNKTVDLDEFENGQKWSSLLKKTRNVKNRCELPPVYPNGWIPLIESRDIAIGQCKPVTALGQHFVVFRGKTGKSYVLDAYCPHLGAHLGVEGKVYDDCIECPFHGWRFSGEDGLCVRVPYSNKNPKAVKVKTWETIEQSGFICVWHHAENNPPTWKPPLIPEIEQGLWTYKGRLVHFANCHIQEIPENGADTKHIDWIHKSSILTGKEFHPDNWWNVLNHVWDVSWSADPPPHQYMASVYLYTCLKLFGISLPWIQHTMEVKQIGPALVYMRSKGIFGKGVFIQHIIPELPFRQKIIHYYYSARFSQIFSNILFMLQSNMVDRDIRIWNHKRLLMNPAYTKDDKTIAKFRKWYSQFYSENSPKFTKSNLDW